MPEAVLEAVADVSTVESQPFLSRWLRTLWQLFWSTIPVYILAVLILGAARVWLFHVDGAMADSLVCGLRRWRLWARCL